MINDKEKELEKELDKEMKKEVETFEEDIIKEEEEKVRSNQKGGQSS